MIPVWRGIANTWDCDEMGHMNVRVYAEKAMEGLGIFAQHIGLPDAFQAGAATTLIPRDQHIRYIREVHAGHPISMTACVLEIGDSDAVIYQDMRHPDGRPAAAFQTRVIHANAKTREPVSWNLSSREALTRLAGTVPDDAKPRSLDPNGVFLSNSETTLDKVKSVGAALVGLGTVPPEHCDPFGRMFAPRFIGRMSDSVPNLLFKWREEIGKQSGGKNIGGAVVEYRLVYRKWPKAGDLLQIHSSFRSATDKTHSLVHWVMDPVSQEAWLTCTAVAVTFDLDLRKIIPAPPEHLDVLNSLAPEGLTI